ncbi:biopolymer transporter ExbD [Aurantivibrio plasticivorans]
MAKWKAKTTGEAEVNMTPMLDIVFIMLIFFIVASTFIREDALDVTEENNNNDNNAAPGVSPVFVSVCPGNDIRVDGRAIDLRAVRANIEAKLAKHNGTAVVIETGVNTPAGTMVKVMDQALSAKAKVSLSEQVAQCAKPSLTS